MGKAFCYSNPGLCDDIFPFLGWGFLIFGVVCFYQAYKLYKKKELTWGKWYEVAAAIGFTGLGLVAIFINSF